MALAKYSLKIANDRGVPYLERDVSKKIVLHKNPSANFPTKKDIT